MLEMLILAYLVFFGLGGIVLDAFKKKRKEKKECVIELIVGN